MRNNSSVLERENKLQDKKMNGIIEKGIVSVKKLIQTENLIIPYYQRPYKWYIKNVNQLIDDILLHREKSAYRIGTLILHLDKSEEVLNIVDGQQRTLTILLIHLALKKYVSKEIESELKKQNFEIPESVLIEKWKFTNLITKQNIHTNFMEIRNRVSDFGAADIISFYKRCELVKVVLGGISEAFQFFDSQNARGMDLAPHDLLKAYHLREFLGANISEQETRETVIQWEKLAETNKLKFLFAETLFRVRHWAIGKNARYFTKNEVNVFKGITPSKKDNYPFAKMYSINHYFINNYNSNYQRNIDRQALSYPFQLNQVIVNGKRFFEFVHHYWNVLEEMNEELKQNERAKPILEILDSYNQRHRTGDKYVRNLFNCTMLFYWDKFGNKEIGRITEKIFAWAYKLRLMQHSVQLASIDNYALKDPYVFRTIQNALHPKEVLNISIQPFYDITREELKPLDEQEKKSSKSTIGDLMRNLNYYQPNKN